jgi:purine nucleoside permease
MKMTFRIFCILIMLNSCQSSTTAPNQEPIPIKVVVVAMFERGNDTGDGPGEFQYWVERLPMPDSLPFPQGYRQLRINRDQGVLGMVTGVGTAKAAASVMALGMDPRFDLRNAYWVIAGIAGIDPEDASTGSAAWAEWLVDGDLGHEIDAREIPEEWTTGYIPLRKAEPYQGPAPENNEGAVYRLNPALVDWAYGLTKDIELMDNEEIAAMRAQYSNHPNANTVPQVMKGDQLAAMTYWHGELMNQWANQWVDYWTNGAGNFVTSAMEDTGSLQSLTFLDRAGKVDVDRVLVLRTGSNFTMQYPEISAAQSLAGEKLKGGGYSAFIPAVEAAWRVGSPVVEALVSNWELYQNTIPE